ncbi:MAG: hypothetical protein ACI86M_003431 [Saprospiraceae bacterium]|jgi:hypothetical protein
MNSSLLKTYTLILLIPMISACKTVKKDIAKSFETEHFGIKGINCEEKVSPDAVDSYVGTLDCGCVTFNYDYGKYSNPGPLTRKEEFRQSFDAYHHIKYFKNRMVDPKVNKLFLDSVRVIDVRRKLDTDLLLFECDPCNAAAVLEFKNDITVFPFTISEKQLDKEELEVSFQERGNLQYKYYTDSEGESAMYVTPIQNRFKKKNCLSLTVANSECASEKVNQIFQAVYMKEPETK